MEEAYLRASGEMSAARGEVTRLSKAVVGQLESDRRASRGMRRQLQTVSRSHTQLEQQLNESVATFEATAAGFPLFFFCIAEVLVAASLAFSSAPHFKSPSAPFLCKGAGSKEKIELCSIDYVPYLFDADRKSERTQASRAFVARQAEAKIALPSPVSKTIELTPAAICGGGISRSNTSFQASVNKCKQ